MTPTTQLAIDDDLDYELVDGVMEVKMCGARHGEIGAKITVKLGIYLEDNPIGKLYNAKTTFQIGSNGRMPDVAFVSAERIPEEGSPSGKWEIAPDIAIEVISPNEVWDKVNHKVREYFAADVQQVWLISQQEQEVIVYDSPARIRVMTASDDLTSKSLPGFKCKVADLFQS